MDFMVSSFFSSIRGHRVKINPEENRSKVTNRNFTDYVEPWHITNKQIFKILQLVLTHNFLLHLMETMAKDVL